MRARPKSKCYPRCLHVQLTKIPSPARAPLVSRPSFTTTSILRGAPTSTSLSPSSSISVRMANPSSSHHDRNHERRHRSERERSSSHHHHRTISSTTLLLVLSLILAVLAVMLSLPSQTAGAVGPNGEGKADGLLGYLTPKRTQAPIARETQVAIREAEVARREGVSSVELPCVLTNKHFPVMFSLVPLLFVQVRVLEIRVSRVHFYTCKHMYECARIRGTGLSRQSPALALLAFLPPPSPILSYHTAACPPCLPSHPST
ncbi:hypothetical protein PLICRDRAFT_682938 [Plicaturopsis crispa FD-325 SS-3]|nr:hypothetical protein PLICRDRAFT_682938 [Plicaturopsis crispa FD-325 SS-3]